MNARRRGHEQHRHPILITGGSGFIGCNLAQALVARGERVVVFDALVRDGAEKNARWLKQTCGDEVEISVGDVRDSDAVRAAVASASAVLHLAAQVAVTTSLDRPREDFDVNAGGTLNMLEAVRECNPRAPVMLASTNKVYGRLLADDAVVRRERAYAPAQQSLRAGVSESAPLDFYSPYGCSKGTADQYVRDYSRVYGLRTVVLRMSCIYGPRQFGTEDQGWVAHFLLQAIRRRPITIFGDGFQVRDLLHVSDAVAAWVGALDAIQVLGGRVFNLGGGPENAVSLLELLERIGRLRGEMPERRFDAWRPGDQPWYVSDTTALAQAIGWKPRTALDDGLRTLEAWLESAFAKRATGPQTEPQYPVEEMRL